MVIFVVAGPCAAYDRITGDPFASRSEVIAKNGVAATSHPLATQVAIDTLQNGGTAMDAAIAANALLGLVEPTGNGIGGDLFAIVWSAKDKKLYGINGSGRSPKSLTLEYFKEQKLNKIPTYGPLSVSVPGTVDAWFRLHERFGKLPMSELLAPAIHYAEDGFPVTEVIQDYWQRSVPLLKQYPGYLETFAIDGRAPRVGEIFRNPRLANTLRKIAEGGADVFYRGEIAREIAAYMKKHGGFLSYEDLAEHQSEWVEPLSTTYRGYEVWELPPNGQGIAVLQMLNILEAYPLSEYGFGSAEHIHLFIESKKLVFEDRAKYYADPHFNRLPVKQLISKEYADQRRQLINEKKANKEVEAGDPLLRNGDTIYLTTADRWGNMVSLIQSNYRGMGSGMTPGNLGFVLQNRGELFNLNPGHYNSFAPGKLPFHTIIPAFVTKDGKPFLSFGVMGGPFQPQGHVQILLNIIDFEMNLQVAGDAPRMEHVGSSQPTGEHAEGSGIVHLESGFDKRVVRKLKSMGHKFGNKGYFGGYQAIMYDEEQGVYYAASESRKDGAAAGY